MELNRKESLTSAKPSFVLLGKMYLMVMSYGWKRGAFTQRKENSFYCLRLQWQGLRDLGNEWQQKNINWNIPLVPFSLQPVMFINNEELLSLEFLMAVLKLHNRARKKKSDMSPRTLWILTRVWHKASSQPSLSYKPCSSVHKFKLPTVSFRNATASCTYRSYLESSLALHKQIRITVA